MPINDQPEKRRIGLLGGSFNPAHEGHREISLAALDRLGLDAVWWLVTPGNPLKDAAVYAPYEDRLDAARRIAGHADIVVSDFERRHHLQYTVDTIERLLRDNPNVCFIWLMGADSLAALHRWKDWRRIAALCPFAVFHRAAHGADALQGEAAKALAAFRIDEGQAPALTEKTPPAWVYFSDFDNPLSSTALRNQAARETPRT